MATKQRMFKLKSRFDGKPIFLTKEQAKQYIESTGQTPVAPFSDDSIWQRSLFSGQNEQITQSEVVSFRETFGHTDSYDDNIKDLILQIMPQDLLLYYKNIKKWLVWNGELLEVKSVDDFKDVMKCALRKFFSYNHSILKSLQSNYNIIVDDVLKTLLVLQSYVRSERNINSILQILRRQSSIQITSKQQLNVVTFGLICKNGAFAFIGEDKPVKFKPHPTHRFMHAYKVEFVPDALPEDCILLLLNGLSGFDKGNLQTLVDGLSQSLLLDAKTHKYVIVLLNIGDLGKTELIRCMILIAGEDRWGKLEHTEILGAKSRSKGDKPERKLCLAFRFFSGGVFDELDPDAGVGPEKLKDVVGCAARSMGYDGIFETMTHDMTIFIFCNSLKMFKNKCDEATFSRIRILYSPYTTKRKRNPKNPYELQRDPNFRSALQSPQSLTFLFSYLVNNLNEMSKRPSFEPMVTEDTIEYTKQYLMKHCPNFAKANAATDSTLKTEQDISPVSLAIQTIRSEMKNGQDCKYTAIKTRLIYDAFHQMAYQKQTEELNRKYNQSMQPSHSDISTFGRVLHSSLGADAKTTRPGSIRVPVSIARVLLQEKIKDECTVKNESQQSKQGGLYTVFRRSTNESNDQFSDENVVQHVNNKLNVVNNNTESKQPERVIIGGYEIVNGDWTTNKFAVTNLILSNRPDLAELYIRANTNDEVFLNYCVNNGYNDLVVNANNTWLKEAKFI